MSTLFHISSLGSIMASLVVFLFIVIQCFAYRFLQGDSSYKKFVTTSCFLLISLLALFFADHIALFVGAWGVSNLLLVRLMIHKKGWKAALNGGKLALKNFVAGFLATALGASLLVNAANDTSLQNILELQSTSPQTFIALILLMLGAFSQSAIWPFHRWLISSLNSPTPVSAMMHAGLVNGGGFLVAKFSSLYIQFPALLVVAFILGLVTAFLGTFWKLLQSDIKRMLACSTMGQMGFMMAQCGLGLFAAAIAHLCWHGIFKAYLFLSTGEGAKQKSYPLGAPSLRSLFLTLVCGGFGVLGFWLIAGSSYFAATTALTVPLLVYIVSSQSALPFCTQYKGMPLLGVFFISSCIGAVYALNVLLIKSMVGSSMALFALPLNSIYIAGLILLALFWLFQLVVPMIASRFPAMVGPLHALYMRNLNQSQPHPSTITALRNEYSHS